MVALMARSGDSATSVLYVQLDACAARCVTWMQQLRPDQHSAAQRCAALRSTAHTCLPHAHAMPQSAAHASCVRARTRTHTHTHTHTHTLRTRTTTAPRRSPAAPPSREGRRSALPPHERGFGSTRAPQRPVAASRQGPAPAPAQACGGGRACAAGETLVARPLRDMMLCLQACMHAGCVHERAHMCCAPAIATCAHQHTAAGLQGHAHTRHSARAPARQPRQP
jgi:hypothetical protein